MQRRSTTACLLGLALFAAGCGQPPTRARGDVPVAMASHLEMHGVTLDMAADEVIGRLGRPQRIDSNRPPMGPRSRSYTRWTWPFDRDGHVAVRYVWLLDGRVAAIEATELAQDGRILLSDGSLLTDVVALLGTAESSIPRAYLHYNLGPFTILDITMTAERVYRLQLQHLPGQQPAFSPPAP